MPDNEEKKHGLYWLFSADGLTVAFFVLSGLASAGFFLWLAFR